MSKSPDAFRTISEVADWLGVQAHVLRFWESKFTQLKPVKRAGGRRYYRPADMLLLGGIRKLLHEDGLPIKDVQALLRDMGVAHVSAMSHALDGEDNEPALPAAAPEAETVPGATADIAPPPVEAPMPEQPQAQVDQTPPVTAAAPAAPIAEQPQASVPPQAPPTQDAGVAQPTPTAPAATPPADSLPPADMLADDWQGSLELADAAAPLASGEKVLGFPQADPPPAADIAETPLFAAAPKTEPAAPITDTPPEPVEQPTAVATDSPDGPTAEDTLVAAAGLQPEQPLDFSAPAPDHPAPMQAGTADPSSDEPAAADPHPVHPDPAPYPPHDLDEAARQIDALEFSGGFNPTADVSPPESEQTEQTEQAITVETLEEPLVEAAMTEPDDLAAPVDDSAPIAEAEPQADSWDPMAVAMGETEPEPAELPPASLPPLGAAAPAAATTDLPESESQPLTSPDLPEPTAAVDTAEAEPEPEPEPEAAAAPLGDSVADLFATPESFSDSPTQTPLAEPDSDIAAETAPLPELADRPETAVEEDLAPETVEAAEAAETAPVEAEPQALQPGILAHLAALKQLPPQSQDAIRACADELRELLNTSAN